jgi:GTPase
VLIFDSEEINVLIDEVDITITAGHGGPGKTSYNRHGPDGGNGGKGGDVYIRTTTDLKALSQFSAKSTIKADDGEMGGKNTRNGKNAKDTEIFIPVDCEMTDLATGEIFPMPPADERARICKGGLGGLGNVEFKSARNRTPTYAQPGLPGESKDFHVVLKYLADFGLIGLPNAGKSSLLNMMTNAHAQVGAYPFTTLEANLGVWNKKIIADIPGLISGASQGKGLGIKFLRHVEKVGLILHCVAADSADVENDYKTIIDELKAFSPDLVHKPQLILLTKNDLVDEAESEQKIRILEKTGNTVQKVSIYKPESIQELKEKIKTRDESNG